MGELICRRNKQSLLSYRIAPNGNREHVGSIQQHFCFHWPVKCDGSLRNGPKSDPIQWKHCINVYLQKRFFWYYCLQLSFTYKTASQISFNLFSLGDKRILSKFVSKWGWFQERMFLQIRGWIKNNFYCTKSFSVK